MSEDGKLALQGEGFVQLSTGEVLDLAVADEGTLVEMLAAVGRTEDQIRSYKEAVSDELIRRMDQAAAWTIREGDWEVSAPSPTAGTTEYLPDALEEALFDLNDQGTLSDEALRKALKRTIRLEVEVKASTDHRVLARRLQESDSHQLLGHPVDLLAAESHSKPSLAGIRALEKVPGCKEALEAARVDVSPPRRKVKVSRKR